MLLVSKFALIYMDFSAFYMHECSQVVLTGEIPGTMTSSTGKTHQCLIPINTVDYKVVLQNSQTIEVFRNKILTAWQKKLNVEVILISESINSEIRTTSSLFLQN